MPRCKLCNPSLRFLSIAGFGALRNTHKKRPAVVRCTAGLYKEQFLRNKNESTRAPALLL